MPTSGSTHIVIAEVICGNVTQSRYFELKTYFETNQIFQQKSFISKSSLISKKLTDIEITVSSRNSTFFRNCQLFRNSSCLKIRDIQTVCQGTVRFGEICQSTGALSPQVSETRNYCIILIYFCEVLTRVGIQRIVKTCQSWFRVYLLF
jgi:hypothetical protein